MTTEKLYLVIPAYNEEANISRVVEDWYPVVEKTGADSRLVIVNDGSKDRTETILASLAETHPQLIPLTKPNGGHGAAILFGYRYALEAGADFIFQTDSDGQTLSSEFAAFWEKRHDYDMIIGHRNKRQDGFSRVVVTKVLKAVIRLTFGVKTADANTPFRLIKAEALKACLEKIPADYHLSNVLITVILEKEKRPVCYRPITFRPRQGGVNSINIKRIVKIGRQAVNEFKTIRKTLD